MLKKLLVLIMAFGICSAANGYVLKVEAYDIGQSGGRLGGPISGLQEGDVLGLKIVLENNPYVFEGTPYLNYDGYYLLDMDLSLYVTGSGSLTPNTEALSSPPFEQEVVSAHSELSSFAYTTGQYGFDQITGAAITPIGPGAVDLVWDIFFHCDGEEDVTIDLTLNGLTEYGLFDEVVPDQDPYWLAATEDDLGDLVIHQVPEPMTIALLGLGGLFLHRRK